LIQPHYKTKIEFTTPDPEKLPPPSPEYLKIHAACAKITHLSGAAERIDEILKDFENTRVLSENGASAHVLQDALVPLSHEVLVN